VVQRVIWLGEPLTAQQLHGWGLVTAVADDLLPTIRSRCQRIDFDAVPDERLQAALVAEGVPADRAALATGLAGGQLARARAIAGPLGALRDVFVAAPSRLDGHGATALALAEELNGAVDEAAAVVADRHREELAEFDAEMERHGYSDRDAQRLRRRVEDRHKRETRRTRIDLLLEGVTAIESAYRDALAAPDAPRNPDRPALVVGPRDAARALDACREARDAFLINEKGLVRLTHLLLSLPAAV
jgi:hypothetical protein